MSELTLLPDIRYAGPDGVDLYLDVLGPAPLPTTPLWTGCTATHSASRSIPIASASGDSPPGDTSQPSPVSRFQGTCMQ